jgi:SH3-like domain-containing protein
MARTAGLAVAVIILAGGAGPAQGIAADKERDRPTPSGLPVPRYVSLKFDQVNARAAPADDSRLLWIYHAKGLPVQVVAETNEWRRICDPERGLAWVHRRTTDGRRMVMRLKGDDGQSQGRRPDHRVSSAAGAGGTGPLQRRRLVQAHRRPHKRLGPRRRCLGHGGRATVQVTP